MERGKGGAVGWIAEEIDSLHGLVALETIQWKVVQRPSDGKMVEEAERSCCLHLHSLIWQIGKIEFLEVEEIGQVNGLISSLIWFVCQVYQMDKLSLGFQQTLWENEAVDFIGNSTHNGHEIIQPK